MPVESGWDVGGRRVRRASIRSVIRTRDVGVIASRILLPIVTHARVTGYSTLSGSEFVYSYLACELIASE